MSKKFILNKVGQKHYYNDLVTLIQGLDKNEVIDVLYALGLDELVDPNGGLAPYLSADIVSSEERFLNPAVQHEITLTGKLYNFFREDPDRAEAWRWTRDSGNPAEDAVWFRDTKEIVITDADLTDGIRKGKVFFTLSVKVGGDYYTDVIDFSTVISLNAVQIQASHSLFLGGTPSEISLQANVSEGIYSESYKWYVNDVLKAATRTYKLPSSIIDSGKVANIRLEVLDSKGKLYTDFISIPKISNGSQGEPGVPGPPGADGKAKYTWIKYADDDLGTEMSEYPVKQDGTFREYMGVAANKDTPIESLNYADYTWSKYIGEDGIPGENGYMWVVYSQFPEGINSAGKVEVSQDPYDEIKGEWMVYLGLAYNKETITEPNFNGMTETEFRAVDFYWSKIKGEDGHTGYVFDLSNEMHAIPTNSDGKTPSPVAYEGAYTESYLYYGNDIIPTTDYTLQVEAPFGLVFTESSITTQGKKFTVTNVDQMADSGAITLKAFSKESTPKLLSSATFSVVKVKSAPAYKLVPDTASIRVVPGVGGAADVLTPTSIKVKVIRNNGYVVEEVTTGTLTYKYNYQTGDGTPLGINSVLQLSNAGNPTYIQFLYFDTATGMLADLESVPFVRDGKTGDPGTPGIAGNSVEFRYQKSNNESTIPSLVNTDVNPVGWVINPVTINGAEALWMIKATKKSDGSLVGTWSSPVRVSGAQGLAGTTGPIPIQVEWNPGATYLNNSTYKYYIYYRPTNEVYTVIGTSAVANDGAPDTSLFKKETTIPVQIFQTIVAEGGNIGGFIFRNQNMYSQAGIESGTNPTYSNLLLSGFLGLIKFSQNIEFTKTGLIFYDSNKKKRIEFGFSLDTDGVPYLRFYDADGNITWEAGKTYTAWNTQGTTQPSWGEPIGARLVTDLGVNPDVLNETTAKNYLKMYLANVPNANSNTRLLPTDDAYYIKTVMPEASIFNVGTGTGYLLSYNNGDIAANENQIEGLYKIKSATTDINSSNLATTGWYLLKSYSGFNGSMLETSVWEDGKYPYVATFIFIEKGGIKRTVGVVAHTKYE